MITMCCTCNRVCNHVGEHQYCTVHQVENILRGVLDKQTTTGPYSYEITTNGTQAEAYLQRVTVLLNDLVNTNREALAAQKEILEILKPKEIIKTKKKK